MINNLKTSRTHKDGFITDYSVSGQAEVKLLKCNSYLKLPFAHMIYSGHQQGKINDPIPDKWPSMFSSLLGFRSIDTTATAFNKSACLKMKPSLTPKTVSGEGRKRSFVLRLMRDVALRMLLHCQTLHIYDIHELTKEKSSMLPTYFLDVSLSWKKIYLLHLEARPHFGKEQKWWIWTHSPYTHF